MATEETKTAQQAQAQQPTELQILQARQQGSFMLTPVGQQLKQFEVMQRIGQMYATATIIPDTYRGNLGNCVIALDMAMRMNANPLMIMQNLYIVHGNPAFSSKFLIATINASKRFTPLCYEFKGEEGKDDYGCRCLAYEASDTERREPRYGDWVTIGMAKKEGWYTKSGSKWQTMPGQMLRYRAAAFWQRVYCPEISMGLMTAEEAADIVDVDFEEMPKTRATAKSKLAQMAAQAAGIDERAEESGQRAEDNAPVAPADPVAPVETEIPNPERPSLL